jgi:predicted MFS family arabinose efflux permease
MSTPSTARSHGSAGHAKAHAAELASPAKSPAGSRRWWVLAIIGIAQLMLVLDGTIVNLALPNAQRALNFADTDRIWIVTAYALTFGSFLLLGGRLGDIFGRKWTFIGGLAGFAIASAAGGAAPDFAVLVSAERCRDSSPPYSHHPA